MELYTKYYNYYEPLQEIKDKNDVMMANICRIPPLFLSSSFSKNDSLLSFPISSIYSYSLSVSLSLSLSLSLSFSNFFGFSLFISVSFPLVLHHLPFLSFYFSLFSLSLQQTHTLSLSLSNSLCLSLFHSLSLFLTHSLSLSYSLSLSFLLTLSLYSPTLTLSLNHHNGTL